MRRAEADNASANWTLDPDRCFSPNPAVRNRAHELYDTVRTLPLVCPHGHVPARLLADPQAELGNPAQLFIVPDHYVFRMLHSQGVPLPALGVGNPNAAGFERDPRRIWQLFCENFHLFAGTPTGLWLKDELIGLFGIDEKPNGGNAQRLYDQLESKLSQEEFGARALFERFQVEVLCTTDAATDDLQPHASLQAQGLPVLPTFRPDRLLDVADPAWLGEVEQLGRLVAREITDLRSFITALAERRAAFRDRGATATDHDVPGPHLSALSASEAQRIFGQALRGETSKEEALLFRMHMLLEMASMSVEDGLVMQLHVGSYRNHNRALFEQSGRDMGADIPVAVDWTRGLADLLNRHGSDPRFRLIVFTLDESSYARELAPLAGHYPALRLGAPWWFFDSVLGMERYLDSVVETAGIYNLAGFNDDTRAFPSIPSRHDVWRRVTCNWLADKVERGLMDAEDASRSAAWLAYDAARAAYKLDTSTSQTV